MKIFYSDIRLNGGSEMPKSLAVETRRRTQTEYAIDSAEAKIFDRGNSRVSVSFALERAHKSECAADEFAAMHAASLGALAPATLTFELDDSAKIEFRNATPVKIKTESDKLMTTVRYEFSAQKPLMTK